jgi:hypothetical protein
MSVLIQKLPVNRGAVAKAKASQLAVKRPLYLVLQSAQAHNAIRQTSFLVGLEALDVGAFLLSLEEVIAVSRVMDSIGRQ